MIDSLRFIDIQLFFFINHTLANPVFDFILPLLTDMNKTLFGRLIYFGGWLSLMVWGGKKGRITGILILLVIILADQSSNLLKNYFGRMRPCFTLDGVRTLVDCGPGKSFPSSHAMNNFAAATVISSFYKNYSWCCFIFASLIAFSRPYAGVHYPSDIAAGSMIGILWGILLTALWRMIEKIRKQSYSAGESPH